MIETTMQWVKAIRVKNIKHFPQTEKGVQEFWVREIVITKDGGEQLLLKLFSTEENTLTILRPDGESMERMPDPPDCPACGGTGKRTLHKAAENDPCPQCNGEGVAQS